MSYFNDIEYKNKVFSTENPKANGESMQARKSQKQNAFELAHDVRKFEIGLFWKRGTYYWAFILATFTAYFAATNKMLGCNDFSLSAMASFSLLPKIALLLISFLALFFCLSWTLVNKGSKFWQKNWEAHIDMLEDEFSGKLYKTFLNTESAGFEKCPLSTKAYDYSVTKITMLGSIVLSCVSFLLVLFHIALLFCKNIQRCEPPACVLIAIVAVFLALGIFVLCKLLHCRGNTENQDTSNKWYQR